MPGAGSLTQVEHSVLLHAFGLHETTRVTDAEIAERFGLNSEQVADARRSGVAKMLRYARSNRERFQVVAELLEAHPDVLGELLQRLVPAALPPKPPRPKREPADPPPVYRSRERRHDEAVWDETLRAWVARVDRALLDRDGAHYFGAGSQDAIGFFVCRGGGWPVPYAFGIYWAPDDRHTAGIDWERPQPPIRTTVGNDPLVIAFDDAPAAELAVAREVDPFVWKDD